MNRKTNTKSGIYNYLEALGVLKNGDAATIKAAKALYYKNYKREWRKAKRNAQKSFEILLNDLQLGIIGTAAKKHGRSKTSFIREAAIAYCNKQYLVPKLEVIFEIRELLTLNYDVVLQLLDENRLSANVATEVLAKIEVLETKILKLLFNPNEKG